MNSEKNTFKERQNQFIKFNNENVKQQWNDIVNHAEAVYVYHSQTDADAMKSEGVKISKVTVVGIVKFDKVSNTYNLCIGWSRCNPLDKYVKRIGNLIAAKRANDPYSAFSFDYTDVYPVYLSGFARPILKGNFMQVAAAIVSVYERIHTNDGTMVPNTEFGELMSLQVTTDAGKF